jgi:hypothetical protein
MANEQKRRNATDSRKSTGQTAYKRRLAYQRLGVDPKDVERMPFFRTDLARIARCLNLGRAKGAPRVAPIDLLQSSEDAEARKAWKAYSSVPESYRRLLPAEAFCHAGGVSFARVLEAIAAVAVRQGAQASAILASVIYPRVLNKTIERALHDTGTRERALLLRAVVLSHLD